MRLRKHRKPLDDAAVGAEIDAVREGFGAGGKRLAEAEPLQHARDLVVERDGARLVIDRLGLINDSGA